MASDGAYTVNDRDTELTLLYIDDLVEELLDALEGREHRCRYNDTNGVSCIHSVNGVNGINGTDRMDNMDGMEPEPGSVPDPQGMYCYVPVTHRVKLGELVDLLESFKQTPDTLLLPELPPERTFVVGSPMAEVLSENLSAIRSSDVHARLSHETGVGIEKGKYILLSAHREENIDTEQNFHSLFRAVNTLAQEYDMPVLYSCHPRSRKRLEESGFVLDRRVIPHEPLGFHDYNRLQMDSFCTVSDSGTLPEESAYFSSIGCPFPAVCIRTSTERPEAMDKGNFVISGITSNGLLRSVELAVEMNRDGLSASLVPDYTDTNFSSKVVKIIQSYTQIVDMMVWRKAGR